MQIIQWIAYNRRILCTEYIEYTMMNIIKSIVQIAYTMHEKNSMNKINCLQYKETV